jgi:hypothetical protein
MALAVVRDRRATPSAMGTEHYDAQQEESQKNRRFHRQGIPKADHTLIG